MKHFAGRVNLKKNELVISYEEEVPDELLKSRLAKAGYPVAENVCEK